MNKEDVIKKNHLMKIGEEYRKKLGSVREWIAKEKEKIAKEEMLGKEK